MTLEKFRIRHSELIEHYQFIESHLKGMHNIITNANWNSYYEHQCDYDKDSLFQIVQKMKDLKKQGICVFSDEEYTQLEQIARKRNFWCHNAYTELVFGRDGLKKPEDIRRMVDDLLEAEKFRELVYQKKMSIIGR